MYLWNKFHVQNKGGPPYIYHKNEKGTLALMGNDDTWYRVVSIEKDEMDNFIPIELSHLFFTFKHGNGRKWDSLNCIPKDDLKNILKEIAKRIV